MNKLIGGILLIVGTSVGGGMLALPVATAQSGFLLTILLLFATWLVMAFCAFLLLECNLWLPEGSNLISMAHKSLGPWGAALSWLTYLALLYTLLCVYISGGTDILHSYLKVILDIPVWASTLIVTCLFGFIVYEGIKSVDYINRFLMFVKLILYLLLIGSISPYINLERYSAGNAHYLISAIMVVVTSYGFAIIIPSLRSYFKSDVKALRKTVFLGTLIPLIIYLLWEAVILGTIPATGKHSLLYLLQSGHSASELSTLLNFYTKNSWISKFASTFAAFCVATSFLGVSLSLTDFLADGLRIKKKGFGKLIVTVLTFLPPLIIILFYPNAFIYGLSVAGIFVVILLMLMPAMMVWSGRYFKNLSGPYKTPGGKFALVLTIIVSLVTITIGIIADFFM